MPLSEGLFTIVGVAFVFLFYGIIFIFPSLWLGIFFIVFSLILFILSILKNFSYKGKIDSKLEGVQALNQP